MYNDHVKPIKKKTKTISTDMLSLNYQLHALI